MKSYLGAITIFTGSLSFAAPVSDPSVQRASEVAMASISQMFGAESAASDFQITFEYEVSCEDDQPILFRFDRSNQACRVRVGSQTLELLSIECRNQNL